MSLYVRVPYYVSIIISYCDSLSIKDRGVILPKAWGSLFSKIGMLPSVANRAQGSLLYTSRLTINNKYYYSCLQFRLPCCSLHQGNSNDKQCTKHWLIYSSVQLWAWLVHIHGSHNGRRQCDNVIRVRKCGCWEDG